MRSGLDSHSRPFGKIMIFRTDRGISPRLAGSSNFLAFEHL
jgi:hypothetical protein